ncbi:MAG TPA: hypothetical protein VKI65_03480, partial [Gemmataceae bacterium]|nr:hypothetical protein [Gemmataceae bacterium]
MSFWVLDTDTLTLLQHNHPVVSAHAAQHTPQELGTTVITVEEQLAGWYRELRKARTPKQVARAYRRLAESVTTLSGLPILT